MNLLEVTENEITFLIPNRKDEIKSFKCTECHTKPLAEMQSKDIKKAPLEHKIKTRRCKYNELYYLPQW